MEEIVLSVVYCGRDQLLCSLIVGIPSSGISFPLSLFIDVIRVKSNVNTLLNSMRVPAGLSLRAGGWGFPPDTMNVVPCYFHWKLEEK